jgi:hypothetical protein
MFCVDSVTEQQLFKEETAREYYRKYNEQNKDKTRDSKRNYYLANNDRRNDYDREHYIRNKDSIKDYNRKYYLKNKDTIRKVSRDYSIRNQDKKSIRNNNYYSLNKATMKESMRKYYVKNKENPDTYSPRNSDFKSWKTPELVREYFESLAKLLFISHSTDWYRISRVQICNLGGVCIHLPVRRFDYS